MSVDALAMIPMVMVQSLGIEFHCTYVAGRGGEGAALDSADEGRSLTGGEHDVRWCGLCWGGDGGDGTRCDE